MYIDKKGNVYGSVPNGTMVLSNVAHECPACHVMSYYWVNAGGETSCAKCHYAKDRKPA